MLEAVGNRAAREVSGGTAFEAVLAAFAADGVVLAPDSADAEPLQLIALQGATYPRLGERRARPIGGTPELGQA